RSRPGPGQARSPDRRRRRPDHHERPRAARKAMAAALGPLINPSEPPSMPFRLLFADNGFVHVCGHRGNSMHAPENTLAALESARRQGASACEIDVVLSRHGEIVLSHDELLDRTTDAKGAIGDHDLAALQALDAGAWFCPEFGGTRIPTLIEAIEAAKSLGRGLGVEMKERRRVDAMLARFGGVLRASGAEDEVVLPSFDQRSMLLAKERIPGIRTEIITHARHVDIVAIARAELGRAHV